MSKIQTFKKKKKKKKKKKYSDINFSILAYQFLSLK